VKLGITLYNFHSIIDTFEDLDNVLERLATIGVQVVQVSGIGKLDNYKVAEYCKKHNMEVCLTHVPMERILNDTDALIDEHKALGCNTIGLGWSPKEYRSVEGMKKYIADFTPAAQKIKAAGMQYAYHNHHFELERYEGRTQLEIMIEDTDPDLFNFILDTHWLQTGGVYPPDYIRKVKGRMKVCHFKDYKIVNEERMYAEIGTGNIDLDECYRACVESGVEYIIIEQDSTDMDLFESAEISFRNLNEIARRNS
jgi:sugar phosphate isomerase/epimerase